MGNPTRRFVHDVCVGAKINYDENEIKIWWPHDVPIPSGTLTMDIYSAPDLILPYTNGNTNQDEWRRRDRLKILDIELLSISNEVQVNILTFKFKECISIWDKSILELDIPLGKFKGMTLEQVNDYKKNNVFVKFS